jgi:hypothetical protein
MCKFCDGPMKHTLNHQIVCMYNSSYGYIIVGFFYVICSYHKMSIQDLYITDIKGEINPIKLFTNNFVVTYTILS